MFENRLSREGTDQEGGVLREAGSQGEREKAESLGPANCQGSPSSRATLPRSSPLLIDAGGLSPEGRKRVKETNKRRY